MRYIKSFNESKKMKRSDNDDHSKDLIKYLNFEVSEDGKLFKYYDRFKCNLYVVLHGTAGSIYIEDIEIYSTNLWIHLYGTLVDFVNEEEKFFNDLFQKDLGDRLLNIFNNTYFKTLVTNYTPYKLKHKEGLEDLFDVILLEEEILLSNMDNKFDFLIPGDDIPGDITDKMFGYNNQINDIGLYISFSFKKDVINNDDFKVIENRLHDKGLELRYQKEEDPVIKSGSGYYHLMIYRNFDSLKEVSKFLKDHS